MTGLVIGASADAVYAIQVAKKMGVKTVAIDGDPSAKGLEYADEKHIIDISDIEKVKELVKEIQPDFLIPIPIGKLLSVAGEINEQFNLKGVKRTGGVFSTDKYQFHMKLKENQLRKCECILVNSDNKEVKYTGKYPVIIKPRYGSGSRDVYFLDSEQELKNALKKVINKNEDFILEELEEGEEFGVDASVIDGTFQLILLRKKIITPPPIRQAIGNMSIVDDIELLKSVESFFQKIVTCMELNQCLLNADIIINKNGIFPIEVSARPSGHNLHSVFVPMVTGVDMIGEYIKYLKGEHNYSFAPKKNNRLMIRYFNLENCEIRYVPTEQELEEKGFPILKWKCNINVGDKMGKVVDGHSIMGRGYFVIEGESEDDLKQQAESILAVFKTEELK